MQLTLVDSAEDRVIFNVSNGTKEELDNRLNLFFTSQGYKLKSKDGETITFEKGNRTARVILGAFVKYHKQSVSIKSQGDKMQMMLQRESSGISGGLIGMNQVKKEFHRLSDAFKGNFNN
jgi:hypothetical protein